jgi:hypothetical protein
MTARPHVTAPTAGARAPEARDAAGVHFSLVEVVSGGILAWVVFTVVASVLMSAVATISNLFGGLSRTSSGPLTATRVAQESLANVWWFLILFAVCVLCIGIGSFLVAVVATAIGGALSLPLRRVGRPIAHLAVYFALGFCAGAFICSSIAIAAATPVGGSTSISDALAGWALSGGVGGVVAGISAAAGWVIVWRFRLLRMSRRGPSPVPAVTAVVA